MAGLIVGEESSINEGEGYNDVDSIYRYYCMPTMVGMARLP